MLEQILQELNNLKKDFLSKIPNISNLEDLKKIKGEFIGSNGLIHKYFKKIKEVSSEEKRILGKTVNEVKTFIENKINEITESILQKEKEQKLKTNLYDPTLPGRFINSGSLHPISLVTKEIIDIFKELGYVTTTGPEIEYEYYNFDMLNIPDSHPARDMQDTFYVKKGYVLRTHTSPVQIRTMLKNKLPIKILSPGKVYRSDYDPSHSPMFHQIEGLYIGKGATFATLKGTLLFLAKKLFGESAKIRLRPSYFPFTEPSAEVDISCVICGGKGCKACKYSGWMEILGAGMVHPNVLKNVGLNPQEVRGFAFGLGIERIAMLKYGVDDIRLFFENDVRFLYQFPAFFPLS